MLEGAARRPRLGPRPAPGPPARPRSDGRRGWPAVGAWPDRRCAARRGRRSGSASARHGSAGSSSACSVTPVRSSASSSAGRASRPKAVARRSSRDRSGWSDARRSAARSTVASIQAPSPVVTRAMTVLSPASSARERVTKRRCAARATFSAWASGSASMTLASASATTRPGLSLPIASATAASTSPTRSKGRGRESVATLRATQASHSRSSTRRQTRGSRCCRSRTSAMARWVAMAPLSRAMASSPTQNS